MYTLRRWLELLPDVVLSAYPVLWLAYAVALLSVAQPVQPSLAVRAQMDQALDAAETGFRNAGNMPKLGEVFAFRALLARQRDDIAYANNARHKRLPGCHPMKYPGEAGVWRRWRDSFICRRSQGCSRSLVLATRAWRNRRQSRLFAGQFRMLSGVYGESGELRQAEVNVRRVLTEARDEGDLDDVAHAQLGLAYIAYEWNDLDAAQQAAQEALDLGEHFGNDEIAVGASLMLARIEYAKGRRQPHSNAALDFSPVSSRCITRPLSFESGRSGGSRSPVYASRQSVVRTNWRESRRDDVALACTQREREEILWHVCFSCRAKRQRPGHTSTLCWQKRWRRGDDATR